MVVKDKPVGPINVKILHGTTIKVLSCSEITATLVFPNNKTKLSEKGNLLHELKRKIDPSTNIATFSPKFLRGSKMQFIRFKFTATVKVQLLNRTQFLNNNQFNSNNPYNSPNYQNQVRELKIESDLSEEFVVLRYITIFFDFIIFIN